MLGARHLCLGSKTLVSCSHDSTCMECSPSRWPGSVGIVRILLGCGGISIGVDCPKQPRLLQGVRKVGRAVEDTVFLKWLRRRKEPPRCMCRQPSTRWARRPSRLHTLAPAARRCAGLANILFINRHRINMYSWLGLLMRDILDLMCSVLLSPYQDAATVVPSILERGWLHIWPLLQ